MPTKKPSQKGKKKSTKKKKSAKKMTKKKSAKKSRSKSRMTRSERDRRLIAQRQRLRQRAAAATEGPTRCPRGEILREAYPRKAYTRASGASVAKVNVPSTCIRATGRAKSTGKKGKQLFVLERGVLGKFGYTTGLSVRERHEALDRAGKKLNALSLFRRLKALQLLNRNRNPNLAKLFGEDADYVRKSKD